MVPTGAGANCSGNRPVLLNAHGTTTARAYNIADVNNNEAGALLMAMFAAQGYIVVSPNYLGYDKSSLSWHPWSIAEANAVDMVDGLRAAKADLAALNGATKPSAKLLITGYSEGGYIAMATHKIIERDYADEFTVTASGPMSGAYNWVKTLDTTFGPGPVPVGGTIFLTLILTGYQKTYGDMYPSVADAFQAPFAATAETLFPSDVSVATLQTEGKLPANDPGGVKLFGAGGLLTDWMRQAVLNPSPTRKRIEQNAILGWTPKGRMVLCGGELDPTAFFFNATDAQADFASRNVTVPTYNFENRATLPAGAKGDALYNGFQAAKTAAGPAPWRCTTDCCCGHSAPRRSATTSTRCWPAAADPSTPRCARPAGSTSCRGAAAADRGPVSPSAARACEAGGRGDAGQVGAGQRPSAGLGCNQHAGAAGIGAVVCGRRSRFVQGLRLSDAHGHRASCRWRVVAVVAGAKVGCA